ncbi:MAG: DUF2806 domain-containing protein [Nitrospinae bacterium]|nr:DUF2806 domain-containing protein [Nitrospinota bacterium]
MEEDDQKPEDQAIIKTQNQIQLHPSLMKVIIRLCECSIAALDAGKARLQLSTARSIVKSSELLEKIPPTSSLQERINGIVIDAIDLLSRNEVPPSKDTTQKEIDDDWLEAFRREASDRSFGEMREAFVRILAGEIQEPGTFSIKAVRTMGFLDPRTARTFLTAVNLSFFYEFYGLDSKRQKVVFSKIDFRIPALNRKLGNNGLQDYGLDYQSLVDLMEDGLIQPELNSYAQYKYAIMKPSTPLYPMIHQGKRWALLPTSEFDEKSDWGIAGAMFTRVGRELANIVDTESNPEFLKEVKKYFLSKHLEMKEVLLSAEEGRWVNVDEEGGLNVK